MSGIWTNILSDERYKSAPFYGSIILMFEHNEAERVKEERDAENSKV